MIRMDGSYGEIVARLPPIPAACADTTVAERQ